MTITYQRDGIHCKVTPHVKEVTISEVSPADNSDNLDCVKFNEIGWQCVAQRGVRHVGQKVVFIPPESILPFELSELLDITKYLSTGRIRVTKLRGNRSEGIIVEKSLVEPYLPYILKWEDPPSKAMGGDVKSPSEVSFYMHTFYKMPNILNEPYIFNVGEDIWYSEKIHGTNWRTGKLPHPVTENIELYTGSHEVVLKDTKPNVYWRATNEIKDNLPENILFFGEIYGKGIQNLTYNTSFDFKFFAATKNGIYLSVPEFMDICATYNLPCVEFNKITFKDLEQLRELSEGGSKYADHIKEGCVFVSDKYPEKMAKCISFSYLVLNKRTERH